MSEETEAKPTVAHAIQVARLLWPEFIEIDGMVFVAFCAPENPKQHLSTRGDATGVEAFYNHVHILDCFNHSASKDGFEDDQWWISEHLDFQAACDLGKMIAQSWFAKLCCDFPRYDFRVYYTEEDNPIVRFHRVREGESYFLDEDDWEEKIGSGKILVFR